MKVSATITLLLLTSLSHPTLANDAVLEKSFSPTNEVPMIESLTQNQTTAIQAEDVVVVVNEQDANSLLAGDNYLNARNIPSKNLIKVSIPLGINVFSEEQFKPVREKIYADLRPNIQVIVLIWTTPYAVRCNSITSAVTLGYEPKVCASGCLAGIKNPYFNSTTRSPAQDFNMRLSMLLPTNSIDLAKKLIDKSVLSAFETNEATAYFLKKKDKTRSQPMERFYPRDLTKLEQKMLSFRTIHADSIEDKKDVMFYFTGAKFVKRLETLSFLPGAVADHLASRGGELITNRRCLA